MFHSRSGWANGVWLKNPNLSTDQDDEEKPKLPYLSSIPSVKFYVEFIDIELAPFMFEKSIPDFYGLFLL